MKQKNASQDDLGWRKRMHTRAESIRFVKELLQLKNLNC